MTSAVALIGSLFASLARRGTGRDALVSLGLHGTSLLLSLVLGVVLARALGPASYGALAVILALLGVLANTAALGLPNLVLRRLAASYAQADWAAIRGILHFATRTTGAAAIAVAVMAAAALAIGNPFRDISAAALMAGFCSIPAMALTQVDGAILRASGRSIASQLMSNLLRPAILLAIVVMMFVSSGQKLGYWHVVLANLFAAVSVCAAAWLWRRQIIPAANAAELRRRPENVWQEALPFLLVSVLALAGARIDLILITLLLDVHSAGLYEVAARGADLVLVPITATSVVLAPEFSRRSALQDHAGLQRLATLSCWGLFLGSLPIAVTLALGSQQLTVFAFGADYLPASNALALLSLGYLATMSMGPVHIILGMTGYSRQSAAGAIAAVVVGSTLSLLLIPKYGIEGAAIARGMSQVAAAVWLAVLVRRALGVRTALLPLRWSPRLARIP